MSKSYQEQQEQRRRHTRERLAMKAVELFLERGFHETTTDEIASGVGVSKRTFFRYFPTKEAAVFVHNDDRLARFREWLGELPASSGGWRRVCHASLKMAAELTENRRQLVAQRTLIDKTPSLAAYELELDRAWENAIADTLLEGATDGAARRRARVLAGATMGAIRATLQDWFEGARDADLVARGVDALNWLEHGFRDPSPTEP
jgi:AcrR family transcriptional regulator